MAAFGTESPFEGEAKALRDKHPMNFVEHLLADGFRYAYAISTVDLLGNGLPDIVACDTGVGIYWFENVGAGEFVRHTIHEQEGEWLERHRIADINGDGKPEIVGVDNLNGSVVWFEYEDDPRERSSWSRHYISEGGLAGAYDVAVADLTGDGRMDVAASSWRTGKQFAWFENCGDRWVKHVIESELPETRTIHAVEIAGSGRMDLVGTASSAGQVVWYENLGGDADRLWRKHIIDSSAGRVIHGNLVDMDGDGGTDFVAAVGVSGKTPEELAVQQVVWYEHEGDPRVSPWTKHVICERFPFGFEAVGVDLDGDGDLEVVATGGGEEGRVAVFKHRGDPRGIWDMEVIKENWSRANQVVVADLTGNGRPDIIVAAERESREIRWWENGDA